MIDVIVIGFGNVGFHLCKGFTSTPSVNLVQILSQHFTEDNFQGVEIIHDFENLAKADVYIISVNDDNIENVANKIPFKNRLVVHTSGNTQMESLPNTNRKGVFYPLQTFSKQREVLWKGIPICIEAQTADDLRLLKELAIAVSGKCFEIDSLQRKTLHLAAVFASNFVNHLYVIADEICTEKNIPFEILKPLIVETANKINSLSPLDAQTGPAKRFDSQTIQDHLTNFSDPQQKLLYEILTKSIQDHEKKL